MTVGTLFPSAFDKGMRYHLGHLRSFLNSSEAASSSHALPTDSDEEERYFYIMHRVRDISSPFPQGTEEVVKWGGVAPGGVAPLSHLSMAEIETLKKYLEGRKWTAPYENGIHVNIAKFLKLSNDHEQGVYSQEHRSLVAWYYLNEFNRKPILSFANDEELVFRVPVSWLKEHGTHDRR